MFVAPLSRRRLLGGSIARWLCSGAVIGAAAAGLVVVARGLRGDLDAGPAVAIPLAGAAVGILAAAAPLVGQLGRRVRATAATLLAALALAQWALAREGSAILPDPWSLTARLLSGGTASALLAILPVVVAGVAAVCAPFAAARLRWEALREQALRWDTVQTLVFASDPTLGLARLGAPVRWGRRLRLRPGRSLTASIVARDLLGIVHTPGRSLLGLAGALAAGALWGAAVGAVDPLLLGSAPADGRFLLPVVAAALLGAAALLVAYLSSAAWCRWLRPLRRGADPLRSCPPRRCGCSRAI